MSCSFHCRFPLWEAFTGGTRTLIKQLKGIPSVPRYKDVLRRILSEKMYESCIMNGVLLHELLADDRTMKFRSVAVAGQPIPRQLTRIGSTRSDRFVVVYGCTDVGVVCVGVIDDLREYFDYETGSPISGVEVKVVDTEGQLLKRGERGELLIGLS